MDQVILESSEWSSGPVARAVSFRERWRGLKEPKAEAVLIETRSVHGIGMNRPFRAVGLTPMLRVDSTRIVKPGRVVVFSGCRYVLELPAGATPPETGTTLVMSDV